MTVADVYNQAVKPMPASDRLKLATMILNDLAPESVANYSDIWTDQDLAEFSATSWEYAVAGADGAEDAEGR